MESVLVIARFAQFSGAMILFGAALFRLRFGTVPDPRIFERWHRRVLVAAAMVAMLGSLAWLDIEAGTMGGNWSDAADPQTVAVVLLQTEFGRVWQWNLGSAAALLALALIPANRRQGTLWTALIVALSGFLVATSASTGHAVMHRGWAGFIHPLVQVVHVLAAAAWLGSLVALGCALQTAWKQGPASWRETARYVLPRYSRMGYLAVAFVLLTGCINSAFMVDSIDALYATAYGRVLLVKIGLFLAMGGVAAANRFVVTPAIVNSRAKPGAAEIGFRGLWRNIVIEQSLGLAIIAVVSLLGTMAPAMSGHMEM